MLGTLYEIITKGLIMKILIVYYSLTGNNEKLALSLQERLHSEIFKIQEIKKRNKMSILLDLLFKRKSNIFANNFDFNSFDVFIFISPIWGRIASPMKAMLSQIKEKISKYYFITVCNGENRQKEKIEAELHSLVGIKPKGLCELWINDLLPEDKKNRIQHTFNFKIKNDDFMFFKTKIDSFCNDFI